MDEIVGVIEQVVELRLQLQEHWRLQDDLIRQPVLQLQFLELAQALHVPLQEQLLLHLEVLVFLQPHLHRLFPFVNHLHRLDLLQPCAGVLQTLLPGPVVVLQLGAAAEALEYIVVLQQRSDILGAVISHIGYLPGLLLILILKCIDLLNLLKNDAIEQLMLVAVLVRLQVVLELREVALEFLDPLPVLQLLGHQLLSELLHVWRFHLLVDESQVLLVELEVGLHELHEEEVVVVDEGAQPSLGFEGRALRVAFVGDLLS